MLHSKAVSIRVSIFVGIGKGEMVVGAEMAVVDVGERAVKAVEGESVSEFEGDEAAEEGGVAGIPSETQSLCPPISSTKDVKS